MTEIEQLRKEVNELRERIAQLEARPAFPVGMTPTQWTPHPGCIPWGNPVLPPGMFPPGTIVC
jgi:hypothetical protein